MKNPDLSHALERLTTEGTIKNGWHTVDEEYFLLEGDTVSPKDIEEALIRYDESKAVEVKKEESLKAVRSDLLKVFGALSTSVRNKFYADKILIAAAFDDGDLEVAVEALKDIQTDTQEEADAKASLLASASKLS